MKLRILDDSIRLRLRQSEVATLADGGEVAAHMRVAPGPEGRLTYVLRAANDRDAVGVELSGSTVTVLVPTQLARDWGTGSEVSIEATQDHGAGALRILIEKDFQCLVPRDSGQDEDAFPNPRADAC